MLQEKENYEELNQIGNGEGHMDDILYVEMYCKKYIL